MRDAARLSLSADLTSSASHLNLDALGRREPLPTLADADANPIVRQPNPESNPLLCSWLFCVAILATVEAGLHLLPPCALLSFNQHDYLLSQALDYTTIKRVNSLCGAPDVLVIGSSRAREGLVPAVLKAELELRGVFGADVRNYAAAYARARTQYALLCLLRSSGHMPRILVYGVTPYELASSEKEKEVTARLLELRDLWDADDVMTRREWVRHLGDAAFNGAERLFLTLWMRELVRAEARGPGACLGGMTSGLRLHRQRRLKDEEGSLLTDRRPHDAVAAFMGESELEGRGNLGEEGKTYARRVVELAVESNCEVIVVELPVSRVLRDLYPEGVYDDFARFWETESKAAGVRFVRFDELGVSFGDAEMADQGHPNWTGAEKLSKAVARLLTNDYLAGRKTVPSENCAAASSGTNSISSCGVGMR